LLSTAISEGEKLARDAARPFAQGYLAPRRAESYLEVRFDREIMTRMGRVGLLGPAIPQDYGGAGLGHVACGLAARACRRGLGLRAVG
jgi:glutaryl-CoA dehydrogenase